MKPMPDAPDAVAKVVDITGDDELWETAMRQNFVEWGGRLSADQYVAKHRRMHDLLVRAGMSLHAFAVMRNGEFLGSCQVLSRPLYCGSSHISEDHCIAFVFVAAEHRKHGYAKMLVDHAVHLFASADDQVSLWSDVGAYYERSGLRFAPPLDPGVPQHATIVCKVQHVASLDCEWLGLADMSAIASEHCRLVNRAVDLRRLDAQGSKQFCAVMPTEALYKQLQLQAVVDQEMLGERVPTRFGARTANGHGWIAWTYLFTFKKLFILGVSGSVDEVATLLAAASDAAADYDLQLELFESQLADKDLGLSEVIAALDSRGLKSKLVEREKTLPMSIGNMVYAFPGGYAAF